MEIEKILSEMTLEEKAGQMVIADFRSYADTQERLYKCISDPSEMGRLSLMNIAKSGYFAADRAIDEYARNIWHIK